MEKDLFLRQLEEMMNRPQASLTGALRLQDVPEWDSLALVGVIAMADGMYGVSVVPEDLEGVRTFDDLFTVLRAKHPEGA